MKKLIETAKLRAQAANQNAETTRDQIMLGVQRAYFAVERSQAVLTVAQQTVAGRQLGADQVKALAESKLKSQLDLSFANGNLAGAKLDLADAQNNLQSALAELSNALGLPSTQPFQLAEEPLPSDLPKDLKDLIDAAIRQRPELASLRAEQGAAEHLAAAELHLSHPTLTPLAAVRDIP